MTAAADAAEQAIQARIESAVRARLDRQGNDHAKALKTANDALTAATAAAPDVARQLAEVTATADMRILRTEARATARELGVGKDQLDYVLRLADLTLVKITNGEVDSESLSKAVEKVLTDIPALRTGGTAGTPPKSGVDPSKGTPPEHVFTLAEIKAMSTADRMKNLEVLKKQAAAGLIR